MKISIGKVHFNVEPGENAPFWQLVSDGAWETATYTSLKALITPETTVLDIGAWIGPTVLYSAQLAKKVYAFEPDPIAHALLTKNKAANADQPWTENLELIEKGISAETGPRNFGSRAGGGDSMSSFLFEGEDTSWEIQTISLPDFLKEHKLETTKILIKMDIEGGEYEVIPKLKGLLQNDNISVMLSLHRRFLRKSLKQKHAGKGVILQTLLARIELVKMHRAVMSAFGTRHISLANGQKVNVRARLLKLALFGRFPAELVIK